jgi:hypothetical protein
VPFEESSPSGTLVELAEDSSLSETNQNDLLLSEVLSNTRSLRALSENFARNASSLPMISSCLPIQAGPDTLQRKMLQVARNCTKEEVETAAAIVKLNLSREEANKVLEFISNECLARSMVGSGGKRCLLNFLMHE